MPGLSYKGQFVEYVEAGLQKPRQKGKRIKTQTIRNIRKHPIRPGQTLYHYFAQRSKYCRKLGESICKSVHNIQITKEGVYYSACLDGRRIIAKGDFIQGQKELDKFARADGFKNWDAMRKWWVLTHGADCFPFHGQLIKW